MITGSARATQQGDQVAIQLGAIQLGINLGTATPQQQANALFQGRAVLSARVSAKSLVQTAAGNFTVSDVQTTAFQNQIYAATQLALSSPVTITISKQPVSLSNGRSAVVSAVLTPKKTTASAILAHSLARIPNYGPSLVQTAVQNAFAGLDQPVFNYRGTTAAKIQTAQLADAGRAAGLALRAALRPYAAGTQNWAGVPRTGPVLMTRYLPNFGLTSLPRTGSNVQASNLIGISSAASAISANAINGLGSINGLYGKTAANVQSLVQALVAGSASFQRTSTSNGASSVGAIGGSTLGITAQLAGVDNSNWGISVAPNDTNAILQAIVTGAVRASRVNFTAIAAGVVQGFTGTYLTTKLAANAISTADFKTANTADILNSFINAGAVKLGSAAATNLQAFIGASIDATYTAFGYNSSGINDGSITPAIGTLTGAPGISNFALVNGVGSPVTDTVGL